MTWRPPLLLLLVWLAAPAPAQAGSVIAPPWVNVTLNPCSAESWQLVRWPADGRCYPIFQRGPCGATQELVWRAATGRPVCACPSGHLHHAPTDRCYRRHARGPCPRRHFFAESGGAAGAPSCQRFSECPPGEIFWPADGRCHGRLTRGPCGKGELLALNRLTLEPECDCSRRHMARSYWPHTDSCYQEYTRGPCPHGLLFVFNASRAAAECTCHAHMHEHYDMRTGQCFAPGERGPCPPGNLFVFNNATRRTECRCRPGGLVDPGTGACHRGYTQGPCEPGLFVAPRPDAPHHATCVANPCRRGELFFPADGRCHRIGRSGPCPAGQLVQYERFRGISYRGTCGCSEHFTQNFWPADGRCYQRLTRGPCPPLHAFVYNTTSGRTECQCDRRRGRAIGSGSCGAPPAQQHSRPAAATAKAAGMAAVVLCVDGRLPAAREAGGSAGCRCPTGTVADHRLGRCRPGERHLFDRLELLRITR